MKVKGKKSKEGSDYNLFMPNGHFDLRRNKPGGTFEEGEELIGEHRWNYWREDPMFHVFHVIIHKLTIAHQDLQPFPTRTYERFWYAHQQLIRRFTIH